MSQPNQENKLSEDDLHELELDKKFAEHIKKLNETETISYVDEQGYLVRRTPDGVITRVHDVPVEKSKHE